MATIAESLAIAVQYHQAGNLAEAERIYRQVLQLDPNHPETLHLLGVIAHQSGRHDVAVEYIRRAIRGDAANACFHNDLGNAWEGRGARGEAIACWRRALELDPAFVDAHNNLGIALVEQGNVEEAIECFRRAVALRPEYADAHNNLGIVYQSQGNVADAILCYRRALEGRADFAEAWYGLGVAYGMQGDLESAIASYRRALDLKPGFVEAHNNLGAALAIGGRPEEAIACYRRALELNPDHAEAQNNLGLALAGRGRFQEAIAYYERAAGLKPADAEVYTNMGSAYARQDKLDEAIACYRRALELRPEDAAAHLALGNALRNRRKLEEAAAHCRRAIERLPDSAEAYSSLGAVLAYQGKSDEALGCYQRARELDPGCPAIHSTLLSILHYRPGVTLAELSAAHAEFDRRHASPFYAAWRSRERAGDPRRVLRLGFVSAELWGHPVGYLTIRALENLNPEECEVFCYSDRSVPDAVNARFHRAATAWRDTGGWTDDRLAEQIRTDGIDILFDLAGHTSRNRLLVFARKPAPIQITWAGYVGTTGLKAMDYLLADQYEVPIGAESSYTEAVLRMPDDYICFAPPEDAPPVGPLPAQAAGQVTLASFNNPAKITTGVVGCWAEILRRAPQARFLLRYWGLDDASMQRHLHGLLAREGIAEGRVNLLGGSSRAEMLGHYNEVDLALDPFPYGGGLTTCEALWMGVPVVTCPGETFASRHSLSHLSNVGLRETIARDLNEYVDLAVALAGDLPRLAAIRAGLRNRVAQSPLCDGKRFAENLLALLRRVGEDRF